MRNLIAKDGQTPVRPLADADATVPIDAAPQATWLDGKPDIPGYRILRRIGSSASATVYFALRTPDHQGVALKVLATRRQDEEWVRRFLVGCGRATRLGLPGLVRILDFGARSGHLYAALEYCAGGSLRDRIGPALLPAHALRYLIAIAHALRSLHEAGVVHRNLKPRNVLFRASGALALSDLGAESAASAAYQSPEQARGEPLDARHDLYSLGIIAWEMLTGGRARVEDTLPLEMLRFQPVLNRLLAAARDERYASALELAGDLQKRFSDVLAAPGGSDEPSDARAA